MSDVTKVNIKTLDNGGTISIPVEQAEKLLKKTRLYKLEDSKFELTKNGLRFKRSKRVNKESSEQSED